MRVCERGQAKGQSRAPQRLELHTPLPSSIFLFSDIHSVYFFLPAVKFCTLPQCGGSQLCFRAPFRAG